MQGLGKSKIGENFFPCPRNVKGAPTIVCMSYANGGQCFFRECAQTEVRLSTMTECLELQFVANKVLNFTIIFCKLLLDSVPFTVFACHFLSYVEPVLIFFIDRELQPV